MKKIGVSKTIINLDPEQNGKMRTLWKAKLRIGERQQEFLFRQVPDDPDDLRAWFAELVRTTPRLKKKEKKS